MQFDLNSLPLFCAVRVFYGVRLAKGRIRLRPGKDMASDGRHSQTQIDALKVIDRDNRVWISRFADRRTAAGYHRYPPSMACVWAGAMADGACRPRLRGAAVHTTAA